MNRRELKNRIAFKIWTVVTRVEKYNTCAAAVQILVTIGFISFRDDSFTSGQSRRRLKSSKQTPKRRKIQFRRQSCVSEGRKPRAKFLSSYYHSIFSNDQFKNLGMFFLGLKSILHYNYLIHYFLFSDCEADHSLMPLLRFFCFSKY